MTHDQKEIVSAVSKSMLEFFYHDDPPTCVSFAALFLLHRPPRTALLSQW